MGLGLGDNSLSDDLLSVYESVCESLPRRQTVIVQNTQHLNGGDSLFYTRSCQWMCNSGCHVGHRLYGVFSK